MTLLCTGYEPFGDHETNPSERVARELDGGTVAGHEIVGEVLPVEFDRVADELAALIDEHDPATVVATGLAAGRTTVSVERVGINVDDAVTVPDNADDSPHDERIDPAGADAHLATIPVVESVEALLDAGIPARVSNSAGTHCCNHALYSLLEDHDVPAGFLHLPLTPAGAVAETEAPERGGGVQASLPLSLQVEGVRTVLETTVS
ncbi:MULTISPECIES: pyroglutamyl-peptidase I family protein [Halolamina]|uniref:Pyroglutamyl-peptidase I n=1 Tax=Halolamina pelagica TaxID=699431 RepID=A0A1I5RNK2_9EURY|nr:MULTISPECIES: peptidase [Halolamina]NHX35268.1 peptidase [Halolamina sp. R1-12]SFP59970.1 pyroglutamyl-peptidase [Halolamina pelagica]